jgi:hypothetical protein
MQQARFIRETIPLPLTHEGRNTLSITLFRSKLKTTRKHRRQFILYLVVLPHSRLAGFLLGTLEPTNHTQWTSYQGVFTQP